jgi:hypothetical protein
MQAACGASQLSLVEGDATLDARLNRAPCLTGAKELDFELRTPVGWERVALEDADPEDALVVALTRELEASPWSTVPVRVRFGNEVRVWNDHAARVVRLIAIRPAQ